jgi:Ca2+-binding RTX toxin-like protein
MAIITGTSGNDTLFGVLDTTTTMINLEFPGSGISRAFPSTTPADVDDTINGLAGDDTIRALDGSGSNDTLNGDSGNDVIFGNDGNDRINGGSGNDSLQGGIGNDIIFGGLGQDSYNGDSGADTFVFTDVTESPSDGINKEKMDHIHGFNRLEGDKIDVSRIDADLTLPGDQAFIEADGIYSGGVLTVHVDGGDDLQIFFVGNPPLSVVDFIL